MKTNVAFGLAAILAASALCAQEAFQDSGAKNFQSMCNNMGRGVANMLTCWMELPRNLWIESTRNPYYGWIVGASDGAFLTAARAFSGVTDFALFGLTGPGMHSDAFPDFIWNAKWTHFSDTQNAWNSFNVPKDALIKQQQALETSQTK
ncbi:MAG: hypothetical protein N2595_10290 [bacterium]|nr:hypothetical protein [bacterium]